MPIESKFVDSHPKNIMAVLLQDWLIYQVEFSPEGNNSSDEDSKAREI